MRGRKPTLSITKPRDSPRRTRYVGITGCMGLIIDVISSLFLLPALMQRLCNQCRSTRQDLLDEAVSLPSGDVVLCCVLFFLLFFKLLMRLLGNGWTYFHQILTSRCLCGVTCYHQENWSSPSKFWAPSRPFVGMNIQTMLSLDGCCVQTKLSSGITKRAGITTVSRPPSHPSWVHWCQAFELHAI